jgi:hypothetical protein
MNTNRRQFINQLGLATAGLSLVSIDQLLANNAAKFTFDISLAEFSLLPSCTVAK